MTPPKWSVDDLHDALIETKVEIIAEIKATQKIILDRLNQLDNNDLERASAHITSTQAIKRPRLNQDDPVPSIKENASTVSTDFHSVFQKSFLRSAAFDSNLWSPLFQSENTIPKSGSPPIVQVSEDEMVQEAISPPKSTSFLGIPPEIRREVYKLLLGDCPTLIINPHNLLRDTYTVISPLPIYIGQLLKVCRQIKLEANPLLWSAKFQFVDGLGIHSFNEYGRCILITSLRIDIGKAHGLPPIGLMRRRHIESQAVRWSGEWLERTGKARCFPTLKYLELDFRPWGLQVEDEFPAALLEDLKGYRGWKMQVLKFKGLGNHPKVTQELEQAMVVADQE